MKPTEEWAAILARMERWGAYAWQPPRQKARPQGVGSGGVAHEAPALAVEVSHEVRDWTWISKQADHFSSLLAAEDAGDLSPRDFVSAHNCAPAFDVVLVPLSLESDEELVRRGAAVVAVDIAREPMPTTSHREATLLEAGTELALVDGTNAVCDMGDEMSIYAVQGGPRRGELIAFSDDLRWGLGPALARATLRGTSQSDALNRPLDEASRRRILDWLDSLS